MSGSLWRNEIVGESGATAAPEAPTPPDTTTAAPAQTEPEYDEYGNLITPETTTATENAANVPTKEYADYIIKLVGNEWDSASGSWASLDGPYATALSTYNITPSGATYEAAQSAYYVAYQQYSSSQTEVSSKWSDFVNELLSNSTMNLNTLVA